MARLHWLLAASLSLAVPACGPVFAAEMGIVTGNGNLAVSVQSLKDIRFKGVIRQEHDFSCGSAALATLLTYHYERPTTEKSVFKAMFEAGDQARIRARGFSLLDMRGYLEGIGLKADGFKVPYDAFFRARVPAIVLVTVDGYKHFVVVKGERDGQVLLGDPALGLKTVPRARFEQMWEGIVFVIRDESVADVATHFNDPQAWATRAPLPFGTAINRDGLAIMTVLLDAQKNR